LDLLDLMQANGYSNTKTNGTSIGGHQNGKCTMKQNTKPWKLQTWHYEKHKRWNTTKQYNYYCELEKDLYLYKLSMNLGYKIFENDQLKYQWFDKQSYRGVYNDTTTNQKN